MMNRFLLTTLLVLITSGIFAQRYYREGSTKFSFGPVIGVAASNPLKDLPGNKGWGLGAGGMIQVEHFFRENLSGLGQFGLISFAGRAKDAQSKNKGYNTLPLRFGLNSYAGNFHIGALVGVGLNSFGKSSKTAFAYSPQVGYNFLRNDVPLDLTAAYEGYAGHGGFSAFTLKLSLVL